MRHDFFVHSERPHDTDRTGSILQANLEYAASIEEAVRKSRSPICVSSGKSVYGISKEREVYSCGTDFEVTGKISQQQAQRLLKILGKIDSLDEFRIHGKYLDACVLEFAVQLYGLLYCKEYWPYYPGTLGEDGFAEARQQSRDRIRKLITQNRFGDSRIEYGVIFKRKPEPLIARNEFQQKLLEQLTDKETQVY